MTLSDFLESTGMTQAGFGSLIGISQARVQQILRGAPWPIERCYSVEVATRGALRCESLRPDVRWLRNKHGVVTDYCVPVAMPPFPHCPAPPPHSPTQQVA